MVPAKAHIPEEWRLRSMLEPCSTGQIVALVHAKLPAVADRRAFELARQNLNHRDLVVLASQVLADAAPRRSGQYPAAAPAVARAG
jgi:hypothetical protein